MAFIKNFEATYCDAAGNNWHLVIGHRSGDLSAGTELELDIYSPGMSIRYDGDDARFTKALMGSSMTFSAKLSDNQVIKWDQLMSQPEGDVIALLYKGTDTTYTNIFWRGQLLAEDCQLNIQNNDVSVTFTDGISLLSRQDMKNDDGSRYTNSLNLVQILLRAFKNMPAYKGWKEFQHEQDGVGSNNFKFLKELGLPYHVYHTQDNQDGGYPDFERESVLRCSTVGTDTFITKKSRNDKTRQLAEAPDFINCYDVIEDVCKSFGACIYLWDGFFYITNRASLFHFRGTTLKSFAHYTNASSGALVYASAATTEPYLYKDLDDDHVTLMGATTGRTVAAGQARFTHESAGDDALLLEGVLRYHNERKFAVDPLTGYITNLSTGESYEDPAVMASFKSTHIWNRDSGGSGSVTVFGESSASFGETDTTSQIGFKERRTQGIRIDSESPARIYFGGECSWYDTSVTMTGGHNILKLRWELTEEDGTTWRLRRKVRTLWKNSEGEVQSIDIDMKDTSTDATFFRKVYDELEWVDDSDADYADAFYETLIPHGQTVVTEEPWNSEAIALTEEFADQTVYAGAMVEIDGEDEGDGNVELKFNYDNSKLIRHYFKEDISINLPQTDDHFESSYVWWQLEVYRSCHGPNPNSTSYVTGVFESGDEQPMFRTKDPDGNGGLLTSSPGQDPLFGFNDITNPINYCPEIFTLSGAKIVVGNGENSADRTAKVTEGEGTEVVEIGSSRFGSYSNHIMQYGKGIIRGKQIAEVGQTPSVTPAHTTDASTNLFPNPNLQWWPHKDNDATYGSGDGSYRSLHALVAGEYMKIFGKARKTFAGTIQAMPGVGELDFIAPHQTLETRKYSNTATTKFMPLSVNWDMAGGSQVTGIVTGGSRYTAATAVEETTIGRDSGGNATGDGGIVGMTTPDSVRGARSRATQQANIDNLTNEQDDIIAVNFFLEK